MKTDLDPSQERRDVRNESEMHPSNFGTNSALFDAAGEVPVPLYPFNRREA